MTTTVLQIVKAADLPAIGQPLAGGTFFARHFIGNQQLALVYLGQDAELPTAWGNFGTEVEGTESFVDGLANTQFMFTAESAAVLKLDIAAGDYLPSYVEQALLLAYAKDNPSDLKGWHWSSTQSSSNFAFGMHFDDGYQGIFVKYHKLLTRPIRRLLIQ